MKYQRYTEQDFGKFLNCLNITLKEHIQYKQWGQIANASYRIIQSFFDSHKVYESDLNFDECVYDPELSECANWLFTYVPETRHVIDFAWDVKTEADYMFLLYQLGSVATRFDIQEKYKNSDTVGSVTQCSGPYTLS